MKHRHVIGLDLLRLCAAVLVMGYHFGFWNWTRAQPFAVGLAAPGLAAPGLAVQGPGWGQSLHFGWVGVEIFFVISGYVIAYTACDNNAASFIRSRVLRLAPASWIAAVLILAMGAFMRGHLSPARAWLCIETLAFWPLNAIDGVWWTLGIEVNFYLLVFFMMRKRVASSLEAVLVACGVASGLFWMMALVLEARLEGAGGLLGILRVLVLKAEGNRELQLLLVQHGCFFALGAVLWKASATGLTRRRVCLAMILTACCLLEILGQNGIIRRASGQDLSPIPALLAWTAAMLLLGLSIKYNDTLARLAGKRAGLIRFVGVVTYPLYLVHNAVGVDVASMLSPSLGPSAVFVGAAFAFVLAIVISLTLEPWLRGGLARLWPRPAFGPRSPHRLNEVGRRAHQADPIGLDEPYVVAMQAASPKLTQV